MTEKKEDALAGAVAAVRVASVPRAKRIEAEHSKRRREARSERDAQRRQVDALRARLAAIAPKADRWFERWVRAGRLKLVLRARPDLLESRVGLPRSYIHSDGTAVWSPEAPNAGRGMHRWYDFALGTPHSIRGGLSGIKFFGGVGGDLGTVRNLAELARKKMKCPPQRSWDGMQKDILHVGLRVADLLQRGNLEEMIVASLRQEASHVAVRLELDRAERASLDGEPDGEERYREAIGTQRIMNDALTTDMLLHGTRRVGRRSRR